jgi:hypothetical protein
LVSPDTAAAAPTNVVAANPHNGHGTGGIRVDHPAITPPLPDEFQPSALVERIILGAIQADQVRLHGAIVAALELYGVDDARRDVFAAALDEAAACSPAVRDAVAAAIRLHMATAA